MSVDDGLTWSEPRDLSSEIRPADWNSWYATGPVHGIQLTRGRHAGRLVFGVNTETWNGERSEMGVPPAGGWGNAATIASHAEDPGMTPRVTLTEGGARRIPCAVLLPRDHDGETPLPVLMDPYGGPHGQRVVAAHNPHLTSQWFADQGFAVLVGPLGVALPWLKDASSQV